MANKDFKVKNKLVISGLTNANGVLLSENHAVDSHTNLATQYGGTGTTTSPTSGQVLYSTSGSTYAPTTLSSLIQGSSYQADAPSSPTLEISGLSQILLQIHLTQILFAVIHLQQRRDKQIS